MRAVRSILDGPKEGYGCLLHHRRRLDKSILADVATLYCSVVVSAAIRHSSPQLNSPNMYSCILQLHVSGILLIHLDIDMYHVPAVQIHTDVQLYSCTLLRLYGGTATFRTRIPYSGILEYYHLVP